MSTFIWDISEPAEVADSGLQSGIVNLDDLKVVGTKPYWQVETPDGTITLVPQSGGEIQLTTAGQDSNHRPMVNRWVVNFGLVVLILLVAFLVINDAVHGNLTFGQFVQGLLSFLAGLGLGKYKGSRSSNTSAKSKARHRA
jgi:uncharacterized integral membrane protein